MGTTPDERPGAEKSSTVYGPLPCPRDGRRKAGRSRGSGPAWKLMDWLNIHRTTLGSGQFLGCEPVQRATWLCLLAYCADQENGGRIEGAESWGDRKWQQIARVTYSEVHDDCPLWSWDGADLVVWAYPAEKEAEVRRNRENGGRGGRPRKPEQNHLVISGLTHSETETEPPAPISAETEKERNRKGNRKGKEEQQARRAGFSPDQFDRLIPAQLADQPAFVDAWHDWTASRRERRKPISERAAQLQLATLAGLGGAVAAVASIRQSIANDWQGLFAPKDEKPAFGRQAPKTNGFTEEYHKQGMITNADGSF